MRPRTSPSVANLVLGCVLAVCAASSVARAEEGAAAGAHSWYENLSLFGGLDGSKQPQDLGINANMGARFAADLGVPVAASHGLGLHLGAAANFSDAAVHVIDQLTDTSRRTQLYGSVGLYQRTESRVSWALGYDHQSSQYYDDFQLGQVRGLAGYGVTRNDEVGVWFAKSVTGDDGLMGGAPVRLDPISQANGYIRHQWPSRATTTAWAGVANGHDNVVWVLPFNSRNKAVFVYGAELHMPLSESFAITGAANFLTPTSTGTVDAHLGLAWYPGRNVYDRASRDLSPRQSVANNPTFSVDLRR